jgi:parvulin-like peptidyl-prolyl isomerase
MIKQLFTALLPLLLVLSCRSQKNEVKQALERVTTISEAKDLYNNSKKDIRLLELDPETDTSALSKKLASSKPGELFFMNGYGYKFITDSSQLQFRVKYIFLDGARLSKAEIDLKRKTIIESLQQGVPFEKLHTQYNMDGNDKFGDMGFFSEGMTVVNFEKAVREHKKDEFFTVDTPENNWYHVVKKTHDDRIIRRWFVLQIKE